ncbi:lysoplasmalogenase [Cytobacillus purgationiresistens]|uniref:Membrane protein YhhN n=1 Tax=Cytobacillus purgationiresistens TaxID=863449 RepID=A0ABU0AAL5_9BACI|nr:lysoplasmalogenase [Cytobacillus purgationiresistens]MDQ0268289.1 putative membrane protein YhhN [Cytobacillus purgationiresistens]
MKEKWLPYLILMMGIIYIFVVPAQPQGVKILFKLIPMLLIIFYAYLIKPKDKQKLSAILLLGLFFCMLGDGLLIWFVVGLTAFLIGHIFYTVGFFTQWKFSWPRALTIIPIAIYGFVMGSQLVEALQTNQQTALMIPVIVYIIAISLMFWSAVMSGNVAAMIGSGLFVISDSILAWNKFVEQIIYSGELIMITYYSAQFLIAYSLKNFFISEPYNMGLIEEKASIK